MIQPNDKVTDGAHIGVVRRVVNECSIPSHAREGHNVLDIVWEDSLLNTLAGPICSSLVQRVE